MPAMNELIDASGITRLADQLGEVAPDVAFSELRRSAGLVGDLNLRARSDLISRALIADLPDDYSAVAAVFRSALGNPRFAGWTIWPVTETVTTLGLAASDPTAFEDGLALLSELTPRLTAEFAIRRFLATDLDRALAVVATWTSDPNEHVRRLASEGTRPFLPWAIRVPAILARPESTVPILTALHRDEDLVVRRSVANHLNDLSRNHPDLVVAVAARWLADPDTNTRWVVRHGLRTLIKKAHPGALALQGFEPAALTVATPTLDRDVVTLPGELGFSFTVRNDGEAPTRLAVDYVVEYLKSNGRHNEKVFKLTTTTIRPGETVRLEKRHGFRQMTTRVHYEGTHTLRLQINGEQYAKAHFQVRF